MTVEDTGEILDRTSKQRKILCTQRLSESAPQRESRKIAEGTGFRKLDEFFTDAITNLCQEGEDMIFWTDTKAEQGDIRLEIRTSRGSPAPREHPKAVSDRRIASEGKQATLGRGHGRAGDGSRVNLRRLQESKHLIPLHGLGEFADDRMTHSTTDQIRTNVLPCSLAGTGAHAQRADDEAAVSTRETSYNEIYDP